jgi:hypothetical protein
VVGKREISETSRHRWWFRLGHRRNKPHDGGILRALLPSAASTISCAKVVMFCLPPLKLHTETTLYTPSFHKTQARTAQEDAAAASPREFWPALAEACLLGAPQSPRPRSPKERRPSSFVVRPVPPPLLVIISPYKPQGLAPGGTQYKELYTNDTRTVHSPIPALFRSYIPQTQPSHTLPQDNGLCR